MNGDVESEKFDESGVLAETEEIGKIPGVVLGCIDGRKLATAINIAVNATGNIGKLGDEVHGILKSRAPVLLLRNALLISFGEGRIVVKLTEVSTHDTDRIKDNSRQ